MVIFVVLFISSILLLPAYPVGVKAEATPTYYARVMVDNCYLYKSANIIEGYDNSYFIIPKTYFVQLTDEEGDFFAAKYLNFSGYVKKEAVRSIIGIPQTPYLNDATFRVYSEQSQSLRQKPNSSSKQEYFIPLYSSSIKFIGKIEGEELISDRTKIWYYCCYTADKDYYGYVYSDFCDKQTNFVDNFDYVDYTEFPNFNPPNLSVSPGAKFNKKATGIIVAVLCVPALIFVFLCVKGSKIISHEKSKSKEVKDY